MREQSRLQITSQVVHSFLSCAGLFLLLSEAPEAGPALSSLPQTYLSLSWHLCKLDSCILHCRCKRYHAVIWKYVFVIHELKGRSVCATDILPIRKLGFGYVL